MDLSTQLIALLSSIGLTPIWAVPIVYVATSLLHKYFPNLNLLNIILPSNPATPATPTTPSTPAPASTGHPVLDLLSHLFNMKSSGTITSTQVDYVKSLVEDLRPKTTDSK